MSNDELKPAHTRWIPKQWFLFMNRVNLSRYEYELFVVVAQSNGNLCKLTCLIPT